MLIIPVFVASWSLPKALAANVQQSGSDQPLSIEISPLPIKLTAKPGKSVSADLRVRNSGDKPETLKVSLKTFTAEGPDGHVVLHDPTPSDTYLNWVHFDKTEFSAPAGLWQTIKMTINVPKDAAFGYYYAIQIGSATTPKPQAGSTRVQGAVAIFVLLNAAAPGAKGNITVTHFSANHSTYEFLPANFTVQVRNTGNVHTAPHGNIFIKRGGKQIDILEVNSGQGMVLPKSNRIFTASWDNGFPVYKTALGDDGQPLKDSKGNEKKTLSWDFSDISKLRFGHYTAELFLVYNDGQRDVPITGTLSFWVIPWRIIFAFLIVVLAPAVFVYVIMRRRYGRRLKASGRNAHKRDK